MPTVLWRGAFRFWLSVLAADPDTRRGVKDLLISYDDAYHAVDHAAIRYDGGIHVKHRLTHYHDFFVERVRAGDRVLDIGSGKGELASDLVTISGATVVGLTTTLVTSGSRSNDSHIQTCNSSKATFATGSPTVTSTSSSFRTFLNTSMGVSGFSEASSVQQPRIAFCFASLSTNETGQFRYATRLDSSRTGIATTQSSTPQTHLPPNSPMPG